jgi:hypothetical protein
VKGLIEHTPHSSDSCGGLASAVVMHIQPVEMRGRISGYVISGFFTKKQLAELRLGRKT